MHPYLLTIGSFRLPAFGVMLCLAFLLGMAWVSVRAKQKGQNPWQMLEGLTWLMLSSILGARLTYALFFPSLFWADPLGLLLNQGGLVWYGGVVAGFIALALFCRFNRLSVLTFTDCIAPAAALGLAIGRIGCLLAGCCYGRPTALPWGIQYPAGHITFPTHVHPAPLYETALMLLLAISLWQIDRYAVQKARPVHTGHQTGHQAGYQAGLQAGLLTAWFFIGIGLDRFLLEYVRGDRLIWLPALDLSASQCISLGFVAVGLLLWLGLDRFKSV